MTLRLFSEDVSWLWIFLLCKSSLFAVSIGGLGLTLCQIIWCYDYSSLCIRSSLSKRFSRTESSSLGDLVRLPPTSRQFHARTDTVGSLKQFILLAFFMKYGFTRSRDLVTLIASIRYVGEALALTLSLLRLISVHLGRQECVVFRFQQNYGRWTFSFRLFCQLRYVIIKSDIHVIGLTISIP